MNKELYWYGFRQTQPPPAGEIAISGPFESYDEAKVNRENSKAWDCQVGIPFSAPTKEDAMKRVKPYMP
ncbi:MAG: hypothetical protein WA705_18735 [Candidatus Ozemobacteraceae bacterium]